MTKSSARLHPIDGQDALKRGRDLVGCVRLAAQGLSVEEGDAFGTALDLADDLFLKAADHAKAALSLVTEALGNLDDDRTIG